MAIKRHFLFCFWTLGNQHQEHLLCFLPSFFVYFSERVRCCGSQEFSACAWLAVRTRCILENRYQQTLSTHRGGGKSVLRKLSCASLGSHFSYLFPSHLSSIAFCYFFWYFQLLFSLFTYCNLLSHYLLCLTWIKTKTAQNEKWCSLLISIRFPCQLKEKIVQDNQSKSITKQLSNLSSRQPTTRNKFADSVYGNWRSDDKHMQCLWPTKSIVMIQRTCSVTWFN